MEYTVEILFGKKVLSQKLSVPAESLEYIGYTETPWRGERAALLQYNVILSGHPKHQSTVAYSYMGN